MIRRVTSDPAREPIFRERREEEPWDPTKV
jgi:hypothetical protein